MRIALLEQIKLLYEDENKQVMLTYHPIDKKYYVKKTICKPYSIEVYETLRKHSHLNLATIYEIEIVGDTLVIVEEFINGCTLEYEMSARLLSVEECIQIMIQIMDVCAHLHNQEVPIIHRDIKPSNILLTIDHIKLIDLEIARKYEKNQSKDTMTLGSAGYAAPEQYGFSQSDPRTDIYAIGILLNELLTNKKPNEALAGGKFTEIIKTCIHIDPKQRYQSIASLQKAFYRAIPYHKRIHKPLFAISKSCVMFYVLLSLVCLSAFFSSLARTPISDAITYSSIVFFVVALFRWVMMDAWGIRKIIPCPFTSRVLITAHALITWCILSFLLMCAFFLLRDVLLSMLRAYQLQYQIM